jgi:DNA (cytosine-5)-methyltransferase 1
LTHGSLFTGIGGFDLAAEWAGIKTLWQVEKNEFCRAVLNKNFPGVDKFSYIQKTGRHNLKKVDIISGGFPCQDISLLNKTGAGIKGRRSGLWYEYFRIITELEPGVIVIENVVNIRNKGLKEIVESLSNIGYNVEWQVISAEEVGAPHVRKRMWIIAYSGRFNGISIFNELSGIFAAKENKKEPREWELLHTISVRDYKMYNWRRYKYLLSGSNNGLSRKLDADRLCGLGNAIVPQIAYYLFLIIKRYYDKK